MKDKNTAIPQWQIDLLDQRLKAIEKHPELVKPIALLFEILHRDSDGADNILSSQHPNHLR